MMPTRPICWAAALLALLPVGAARAGWSGFTPGETFTYDVSLGQINAGRARMAIGLPVTQGDRRLVAVQGQAESSSWMSAVARINEYYKMVFDVASLLPESILSVESGTRDRRTSVQATKQTLAIEVATEGQIRKARRTLLRPARDAFSALFAIRALLVGVGDQLELDLLAGALLWRATLKVAQREVLRPERPLWQPRPAWRFEGECHRIDELGRPVGRTIRHFRFWLSDDPDRLLLRASFDSELGHAALELTSYDRPPSPRLMVVDHEKALPGIVVTRAAH